MRRPLAADAEETARLLPYGPLAGEIAEVLRADAEGRLQLPERMAVPLAAGPGAAGPGAAGALLVMAAADDALLAVKCVTVHPGNRALGLPTIQGDFLVKDAATGTPLVTLDAATVTTRRTAALTVLAIRLLRQPSEREPPSPALLIGAGAQARAHAEAFMEALGVREFIVVSRTRASAERLARYLEARGAHARSDADAASAAVGAGLVLAATTSTEPVVPDDVPDEALVAAVGAFRPGMAELSADLLSRREVVVDTLAGARAEAGDLIRAVEQGRWAFARARPLAAFLGDEPPRLARPALFKSVGHAAFDLAAARLAVRESGALPDDEPA